jgi:DNA (cytosine-5)-methyltransferase 1
MLNAIDLFSGYGGITLALKDYSRPIIYCEIEKYCQGIILSRMDDGALPFAPIWEDVTTLDGTKFRGLVDIVYGGFPCQDISVAGKVAGLEGKRSGLFYEIIRICKEASPQFIFLENVPNIRTNGAIEVQEALANIGYDSRWCHLSAAQVGANHKRERWFCLASNSNNSGHRKPIQQINELGCEKSPDTWSDGKTQFMAHSLCEGLEGQWIASGVQAKQSSIDSGGDNFSNSDSSRLQEKRPRLFTTGIKQYGTLYSEWWKTEPDVGRVVDGCPFRVDRIKALGNGVVPLQVKTAFEKLMGIL